MVLHPWERLPDLANMIGLMLTSLGIALIGKQHMNKSIKIIGVISLVIFMFLFLVIFSLFLRDYFTLLPTFTRKFLGIPY